MASTAKERALERLAGKLTSMRASLRGEERALFDQMVASARFSGAEEAEVTAHSTTAAAVSGWAFQVVKGKVMAKLI